MRAVQVGWHHRTVVATVLPVVGLAQFNPGDLGDGVRLVGRLQRPLQQLAFRHRLPCQFRIDTGRTEKQQFVHVVQVRGVNNVALYHHVFINKIRRIRVVGDNAAHFRRRQINWSIPAPAKNACTARPSSRSSSSRVRSTSSTSPRCASCRTMAEPTIPRWPATKNSLLIHSQDSSAMATS